MIWVRIKSWHIVKEGTRYTLCGRDIFMKPQHPDFDREEKTCEACLRVSATTNA